MKFTLKRLVYLDLRRHTFTIANFITWGMLVSSNIKTRYIICILSTPIGVYKHRLMYIFEINYRHRVPSIISSQSPIIFFTNASGNNTRDITAFFDRRYLHCSSHA